MKKATYTIWMIGLLILIALTTPYLWYILKVLFIPKNGDFWGQEKLYTWILVGIIVSFVLRKVLKNKSCFFETFSHELTHTIVALFFGRKIHSFHVEDSGAGMIFSSGKSYSHIPVALSPYCLPIFTYLFLGLRCIVEYDSLWICDFFIGLSLYFHYHCFKSQIGNYQTDINQYPLSFSYTYIITAWLINICIILVAVFPNMNEKKGIFGYGVFSSFIRLLTEWWNNLIEIIGIFL